MPKCDFIEVALQLYLNHTSAWIFSCRFAAYLQNIFFQEHIWVAASESFDYVDFNKTIQFSILYKTGATLLKRDSNTDILP